MQGTITTLLMIPLLIVDRDYRILFIPLIAIAFGSLSIKKPVTGLAIITMSIGFPIYLRFMGRDATTLTTLLIFEFFFISFIKGMKLDKRYLIPILILLLIYSVGMISISSPDLRLKSARMVVGLIAGFMLLLNSQWALREAKDREFISRILLYMVAFQALIAVLQVSSPEAASTISNIFSPRASVAGAAFEGDVLRGRGAIGDYELLSEWIAAVFPLSLFFVYKSYKYNSMFIIVTTILIAGLISTVTRGAIFALVISTILFLLLVLLWGRVHPRILFLPLLLLLGWGVVAFVFHDTYSNLIMRFNLTGGSGTGRISSIDDIILLINRGIWYQIPADVGFNLFIGNGFYPFQDDSFLIHSLYLTMWYQSGILGVVSWFWIFIAMMSNFLMSVKYFYGRIGSGLLFAFVAGLIGILLNEIKVEFLRQECTIQFFLLFVGLGISCLKPKYIKDHTLSTYYNNRSLVSMSRGHNQP